jgi:hypothetical protein
MGQTAWALPLLFIKDAQRAYNYAVTSYKAMAAPSDFHVTMRREDEPLTSAYPELK